MKNIIIILSVLLFSNFFACTLKSTKKNVLLEKDNLVHDTTLFIIDNQCYLNIIQSKSPIKTSIEIICNEELLTSISYGNISLVLRNNSPKIDTVDFGDDGKKEYIIYCYVEGSTYGAHINYIVYNGTELIQLPFDRCEVMFTKEYNDYVIVSYEIGGNISYYSFNNGTICKL